MRITDSGFGFSPSRPSPASLGIAAGLGFAIFVLAYGSILLTREFGRIAAIWPANAFIVAALLRAPRARCASIFFAGVVAILAADLVGGDTPALALALTACNALEIFLLDQVMRRFAGPRFDLSQPTDLVTFLIAGGLLSPAASATAAAIVCNIAQSTPIAPSLARWYAADALGLVAITPALLTLTPKAFAGLIEGLRAPRNLAVCAVLAAALALTFGQDRYPLLFLMPAALILVAFALEQAGTAMALLLTAVVAIGVTLNGHGPTELMHASTLGGRLGLTQVFLASLSLAILPVGAVLAKRRRLESELRQARDAAEAAAAVKAEFMANMSHEIRTPLTAILGFTSLLSQRNDLDGVAQGQLHRVNDAGETLLSIVNDILDFSKLEAGQVVIKPSPTSPEDLVRTALAMFGPQAEAKGLSLDFRSRDALPEGVLIDKDRVRQILLNLIGNAIKFTEAGGVAVGLGYDARTKKLSVEVSDTGAGLSQDQQEKLFQRFSQIDASSTRRHGGTGLGLAICKGLTEAMGGDIGVRSQPGRGSTFHFEIAAPAVDMIATELAGEGSGGLDGLRLLIADDNSANRALARAILQPLGVEVTEADDGLTAVNAALCAPYDAILMDLRMPGLGGADAAGRIRTQEGPNRTIPILAFSADIKDGAAASYPFDGSVSKPISPKHLVASLLGRLDNEETSEETAVAAR